MSELKFGKELEATTTPIPGMMLFDLPVHGDARGWFKENWQREKMVKFGLPDFGPVQNNISFNAEVGVTRGIHAEPWDKFISLGAGRIFGAWVDLREGDSFGAVFTAELDPTKAIFVPRGVGNAFQALEPNTVYTYLVNAHWRPDVSYTFVNLGDKASAIEWPIPLSEAKLSDRDLAHPQLDEVAPMKPRKIFITGADGQVGRALREEFPDAEFADKDKFDITDPRSYETRAWEDYDAIINAAAFTKVDVAETPEGREAAWRINAQAVRHLANVATKYGLALFHFSSEYVFDGNREGEYDEEAPISPLGVYAQTKAAGDNAAATTPRYYIIRPSWVIGDGGNFVRTMKSRADADKKSAVVNDQIGRLTFARDLARAARHLLETRPEYGIYNVTSKGAPTSWATVAQKVYELCGVDAEEVTAISTQEYFKDTPEAAPRPKNSVMKLDKIEATGFIPTDWQTALREYLEGEKK